MVLVVVVVVVVGVVVVVADPGHKTMSVIRTAIQRGDSEVPSDDAADDDGHCS